MSRGQSSARAVLVHRQQLVVHQQRVVALLRGGKTGSVQAAEGTSPTLEDAFVAGSTPATNQAQGTNHLGTVLKSDAHAH